MPPPPPGGGGPLLQPPASPHDPILVLILNLLGGGGGGYLLIGQKTKGILAIVLFLAIGIPTCFAASGLLAFVTAVDGYMQAKSLEEGHAIAQWTFFREHR
jgi:TM2 domain-containing membrane protein YozV